MENDERIINYKGKTLSTKHIYNISEKEFEEIRKAYYTKPNFEEVKKEFINLENGGVKNSAITNYYVKDLMAKTRIYYNKWSIEEVLECKELVEFFISKTLENKKIYPDTDSTIKKIETCFRLGGKGVCSKPANFPIKTVDEILKEYNVNNNYYDFSCGWGGRICGALKNHVNYFGTDPNYLLTERLNQLAIDYKNTTNNATNVDIRTQGSEILVPEWKNKIGVAFSSPPYFYLEDYKIGNQSYTEGTTYEEWKNNYLKPTFLNIKEYLVDNGYFILNINNFLEYKLVEDSIEIAKEIGFNLVKEHILSNIKRTNSKGGFNDNSERILVFMKNQNYIEKDEGEESMDFIARIKNISSQFSNQLNITLETTNMNIVDTLNNYIKSNRDLAVEIKKKSEKRSKDANSYAWHLMQQMGKYLNKSKDEVYIDMLGRYGVFTHIIVKPNVVSRIEEEWRLVRNLGEVTINGKSGIQLQCYFGSSTYTTEEMAAFIDGIVSECKEMGIDTLSDEEIDTMKNEWGVKNEL